MIETFETISFVVPLREFHEHNKVKIRDEEGIPKLMKGSEIFSGSKHD